MKDKQQITPFYSKLISFGFFASVLLLVLDVPWPVVSIFGFETLLGVYLLAVCALVITGGFVLGMVAGVASRKGRRQRSSQAAEDSSSKEAASPSPVGEVVTPKQTVDQQSIA